MAKLHHATLKAAVGKYVGLHEEGKSEEEIRQAIAGDEKGFDEDAVSQIYAAITNDGENNDDNPPPPPAKGKFIVKSEFRDIASFDKIHKVGSDVSDFDKDRLTRLVEAGLVEKK